MTDTAVHAPSRARLIAGFATVYVLWGSTYLAIRIGVETIPPFIMGAIRFLIAGSVLYFLVRPRERPTLAQWKADAIVGVLLLVFGNGAVMWAEQKMPSGIASLIVAVVPLWMVLLDWARRGGRRPTAIVIVGVALGLGGLAILVNPFAPSTTEVDRLGVLALLGGSLSWAVGSLYSKHASHHPKPLVSPAMQMLAGGAGLAIISVLSGELAHFRPEAVATHSMLAVLYLVIFGSLVGYSVYIWLLRVATPSAVSTYAYVNPVVAVFLGWLILSEPLTPRTLVAAAVIVGAVALITRGSGREERDTSGSEREDRRVSPSRLPRHVAQIGVEPNRIDTLSDIDGVEFDDAYPGRAMARVEDVEIPFVGLQHLLENKRATGRPEDATDADRLEKARGGRSE